MKKLSMMIMVACLLLLASCSLKPKSIAPTSTKFDGGGSGANVSSSSVASTIMPPVQYSQAVQGASTEGAIKDTKVYVTETDITSTINKVSVQENENRY